MVTRYNRNPSYTGYHVTIHSINAHAEDSSISECPVSTAPRHLTTNEGVITTNRVFNPIGVSAAETQLFPLNSTVEYHSESTHKLMSARQAVDQSDQPDKNTTSDSRRTAVVLRRIVRQSRSLVDRLLQIRPNRRRQRCDDIVELLVRLPRHRDVSVGTVLSMATLVLTPILSSGF